MAQIWQQKKARYLSSENNELFDDEINSSVVVIVIACFDPFSP